ncbi:MAG: phosphoenolpyruvate--protein phosphotransferase [Desulfobacterota bacterium]|nr:phosphoenolpyruvate--protein phosphotransferase [Thermodesulfobacteriota bacterium]MDW8001945.1 phosphoenolpyruvate--protein phosphotransferase [Deltaproteobacteria bacterium]
MSQERRVIKGIGTSSGVSIGRSYVLERGKIPVPKRKIRPKLREKEINRFRNALQDAQYELRSIKDRLDEEIRKHAFIIDAHLLILQDEFLINSVIDVIKTENVNAEWALDIVVSKILSTLEKIEDPYLRERAMDFEYVYKRLMRLMVKKVKLDLDKINVSGKTIIVAHDLSPADTIHLNLRKIAGFVTDMGGRTSHTSIVARALEIPAVVGAQVASSTIKNFERIIIDGDEGIVIVNPTKEDIRYYKRKQRILKQKKNQYLRIAKLKSETKDGFKVKIGANIELIPEMEIVEKYGGEGIGLYRTEYLYLSRRDVPTEEDHFQVYKKLAERKSFQYVTIRTLDIGGDKFVSHLDLAKELNPAMGLRAIRLCIREIPLFKSQLKGILRASAYGPLRILIPMVSGLEEVLKTKEIINECMKELDEKNIKYDRNIKIGVMVEVPSSCLISDILAKEVDFFSIGTNDLIQYTLAIDRVNEYVSYLYEPLHPAVLKLIKNTVDAAHKEGIEVALCGEMSSEPLYIPVLLGLGIDELSMNPYSIPRAKNVIRKLNHDYCRDLATHVLGMKSGKEAEEFLKKELKDLLKEEWVLNDNRWIH